MQEQGGFVEALQSMGLGEGWSDEMGARSHTEKILCRPAR